MHQLCRAAFAAVLLVAMTGCSTTPGAYGAKEFIRVNDTKGLPTYKASGQAKDWILDASKQAHDVMLAACPDGHPQLVEGMGGMTFSNTTDRGWWWATFTCDHEIPLPGATPG